LLDFRARSCGLAVCFCPEKRYDARRLTLCAGEIMSIKSDKWMRRMAEQHGMIEPFEPNQVRYDAAGQRIVSYGTSSYG
jgi:hypothetical protein